MDLSRIRTVFEATGPFATVYLEARSPADDAAQQVRLRWNELREQLLDAGASQPALDAIDRRLDGPNLSEVQADGRILVASDDGIGFDEPWDAALGAGDTAHWTDVPEVGAFVREEARTVRLLVAIVDQTGARLRQERVAPDHAVDEQAAGAVSGQSEGVHKPRQGALAHNRIQRHADEHVKQNARDIVDGLIRAAKDFRPDLVVLAGEVQGRSAVRDELPKHLAAICAETGRGGTDDDAAEQVLADELRRLAGNESDRRVQANTEQFEQAAAHELAVAGAEAVGHAADMAAVETLLLEYDHPADTEAALLAACAGGDAQAQLAGTSLTDHVAAILRFPIDTITTNHDGGQS